MENDDWLFEALYDLADAADSAGFPALAAHIETGMDILEAEERARLDVVPLFRTRREARPIRPAPADKVMFVKRRVSLADIRKTMAAASATGPRGGPLIRSG